MHGRGFKGHREEAHTTTCSSRRERERKKDEREMEGENKKGRMIECGVEGEGKGSGI